MNRSRGCLYALASVRFIKDHFLMPIFNDPCLGGNDVEFFLDLGKKSLTGTSLLFFAQGQLNTNTLQFV
jgi:hypothetical protein